jgi:2-keto-3-deoxy-L-rhamnonate aldolase RhmA
VLAVVMAVHVTFRTDVIREKARRGETTLGTWLTIGHPEVAEAISLLPLDWVVVDMEHAPLDFQSAETLLIALRGSHVVPLVRVPAIDPVYVKRVLDMGFEGVVFPLVRSTEEAKLAVASTRYPPRGIRGVGPRRAIMYGLYDPYKYYVEASEKVLVLVQIETREALESLDEILDVEGVDGVFVGPNDLSAALGVFRQFDHPEYRRALKTILEAALSRGKIAGIMARSPKDALEKARMGFNFISLAHDITMMLHAYREALKMFGRM